ncbi:MAG: cation-translocating P-type ATPase, partial [Clostridia bacterium]|nr:cation-translocating P-type ATPase [Clostridia bacterium]
VNTAISTIQELHSRSIINKFTLIAQSKARVIRNGKQQKISIHEVVLDDLIKYNSGDQIISDCIIKEGEVTVNESLLTGESDAVVKKAGDMLLSGSFIVSGYAIAKVEHIGNDNYTARISNKAKYIKELNSEIMLSLNKIVKILSIVIIPVGLLMFFNQYDLPVADNVVKTVASIIGMIPEGLILLTSTVLAVSVIRLSKSSVLVQDIYCIETLARVDTLCLDKTGTITEGCLEVKEIIMEDTSANVENILANIAKSSTDINATITAIRDKYNAVKEEFNLLKFIPFSSSTKCSGAEYKDKGSYVIGAPEFVLKEKYKEYEEKLVKYMDDYRIVVLAHSKYNFEGNNPPKEPTVIAFLLITDKIRKEAPDTLKFFKKQQVDIKIISGDNPKTVSSVAKQAGVDNADKYIDATTLKNDDDIQEAVSEYSVFGRVTPDQKKSIVKALKGQGRTVAMTGDGVNDVLALKESDCSIAMANGSDACKSTSMLVLMDSNFSSMPKIVDEGRRTINNIQRSASLFLTKTIYSSLLAVIFIIIQEAYPFMPIQLSLISSVTIGAPSFLLALEPNKDRIKGKFLKNVISMALPSALTAVANIVIITILKWNNYITPEAYSTVCVVSMGMVGIILLFLLAKRRKSEKGKFIFSPYRLSIAVLALIVFIAGIYIFEGILSLVTVDLWYIIPCVALVSFVNFVIFWLLLKKVIKV